MSISNINYAIKITTDNGYGAVVGSTDKTIGLVAGVFYMVTGRPGYTGLVGAPVPTGTSQTEWIEGLVDIENIGSVSSEVNLDTTSLMGNLGDFTFTLRNSADFATTASGLGIKFINRKIDLYIDNNGAFSLLWTGIIINDPLDDDNYKFSCIDDSIKNSRPMPGELQSDSTAPGVYTLAEFPNIDKKFLNKPIPITLGDVNYAQCAAIDSFNRKFPISQMRNSPYTDLFITGVTAYTASGDPLVFAATIKTEDHTFTANDSDLVDKYFIPTKGTTGTAVRIIANDASTGSGSTLTTKLYLEKAPYTGAISGWTSSNRSLTVAYAQIGYGETNQIVSSRPVYSGATNFKLTTSTSIPRRYRVDADTELNGVKQYKDVASYISSASDSDITTGGTAGRPGVNIASKFLDFEGDINEYGFYKPTAVIYYTTGNQISNVTVTSEPANSSDQTAEMTDELYDATGAITIVANPTADGTAKLSRIIHLKLPEIGVADHDNFYVTADIEISMTGGDGTQNVETYMGVSAIDAYNLETGFMTGHATYIDDADKLVSTHSSLANSTNYTVNMVPRKYYGAESSDGKFQTHKLKLNASDIIKNNNDVTLFPYLALEVLFTMAGGLLVNNFTFKIKQIAFVVENQYNISKGGVYSLVRGESFKTTWNNSTAGNPTNGPGKIVEKILREYCTVDSSRLLTTTGFDQVDTLKGDETSFSNYIRMGKQLVDTKNSNEHIREVLLQSMCTLTKNYDGKYRMKPFLRYVDASVPTHNSSVIVHNSIKGVQKTSLSDIYNVINIKYGKDPLNSGFTSNIGISKISESGFPLETDTEADGSLSWQSFAFGFVNFDRAQLVWEACRQSYLDLLVEQPNPKSFGESDWIFDLAEAYLPTVHTYTDDNENSAYNMIREHVKWWTKQKLVITYTIPITSGLTLNLMDNVNFSDAVYGTYTNATNAYTWITRKVIKPSKNEIEIELMIYPSLFPDLDP